MLMRVQPPWPPASSCVMASEVTGLKRERLTYTQSGHPAFAVVVAESTA
jgi:hypothetical protein